MTEYIKAILSLNWKYSSQGAPLPRIKLQILLTSLGFNHALRTPREQCHS